MQCVSFLSSYFNSTHQHVIPFYCCVGFRGWMESVDSWMDGLCGFVGGWTLWIRGWMESVDSWVDGLCGFVDGWSLDSCNGWSLWVRGWMDSWIRGFVEWIYKACSSLQLLVGVFLGSRSGCLDEASVNLVFGSLFVNTRLVCGCLWLLNFYI